MLLSEKIVHGMKALSVDEQRQVLLFVEFLQYRKRQRTPSVDSDSEFTQASQTVMQKRRDAYNKLV